MKKNLILWSVLAFLFVNVNLVKADVLGPYSVNEAPTISGYCRVVLPLNNANAPVTASITIRDESGQQYTLETAITAVAPNCYYLACGTYSIVSLTDCEIQSSNWSNLAVGESFIASSGGYINLKYTGIIPEMQSVIMASGTDDNKPANKPYYATMKVYGVEANGSGVLIDEDGEEYGVANYTGHIGGAHYYYILPGTYTVKTIGTNGNYIYLDINGEKTILANGSTFTVTGSSVNISIIFSEEAL